jgi:hypothetical protein
VCYTNRADGGVYRCRIDQALCYVADPRLQAVALRTTIREATDNRRAAHAVGSAALLTGADIGTAKFATDTADSSG